MKTRLLPGTAVRVSPAAGEPWYGEVTTHPDIPGEMPNDVLVRCTDPASNCQVAVDRDYLVLRRFVRRCS